MSDLDQQFKDQLDQEHQWPAVYMFKFIVPKGIETQIEALFNAEETSSKVSRRGNYVSVTARVTMGSSEEVIEIYRAANEIEGVIAL